MSDYVLDVVFCATTTPPASTRMLIEYRGELQGLVIEKKIGEKRERFFFYYCLSPKYIHVFNLCNPIYSL